MDPRLIKDAPSLSQACGQAVRKATELRDDLVRGKSSATQEQILDGLNHLAMILDQSSCVASLFENVHPDESMRVAAEKARAELARLSSKLELDRGLFEVIAPLESRVSSLSPEAARFVSHELRDFRRAGVDQDAATRQRIEELRATLVSASSDFGRNIRSDVRELVLDSAEQLAGLPVDYIANHAPDAAGRVRITTNTPDFAPFMSYAKSGQARRALQDAYLRRAYPQNLGVLDRILSGRHELASALGYSTYAEYAAQTKMVGSPEGIRQFLETTRALCEHRCKADLSVLLERKQRDEPGATAIRDHDRAYYAELVRAERFSFDAQAIRPFLGYARVKQGVLDTTASLMGLRYERTSELAWHPSVETYDVFEGQRRVGRFHLDMHPRPGKYKHAAMFHVRSGCLGAALPEAALVCNFPDPATGEGPALLEHREVVTFFHEMGHLLHHLLGGGQRFVRFSGIATEWDFAEVPSQLLEEWAYEPETLSRFAVHCDTGEPIGKELVDGLRRSRGFGRGVAVAQQLFYSALSLEYHDRDPRGVDSTALLQDVQARHSPFPYEPDTYLQASFGHLDGYSSLYYTYLWSQAIARDIFERFEERGLFDEELTGRYRRLVLEPGGAKDAARLVEDFLGRPYDLRAFERYIARQ
ncbi:MAG: Zn-dependent oligopeptidase [Myxococcota bacterium]|jgi:thimet oligopeptidase|nr:Zn-dependent oligopeptidase [Myxococcota bacterium]